MNFWSIGSLTTLERLHACEGTLCLSFINFTTSHCSKYYPTQYCFQGQLIENHFSYRWVLALALSAFSDCCGLRISAETQCGRMNMFWTLFQGKEQQCAFWGPHHLKPSSCAFAGPAMLCVYLLSLAWDYWPVFCLRLKADHLVFTGHTLFSIPLPPLMLSLCIICLMPRTWSSTWKIKIRN